MYGHHFKIIPSFLARLENCGLLSGGTWGRGGTPAAKAWSTVYGVRRSTTGLAIRRFLFTAALILSSLSLDRKSFSISWNITTAKGGDDMPPI